MKQLRVKHIVILCGLFLMAVLSGCREYHMTLQINGDGTAAVTAESVLPRKQVDRQLQMVEVYIKRSRQEVDLQIGENDTAAEILSKKIRAYLALFDEAQAEQIQDVVVDDETVRIKTRQTFKTLQQLVANPRFALETGFGGLRIAPAGHGQARLVVYPATESDPRQQMNLEARLDKLERFSFKAIMPGRVMETSLPSSEAKTARVELEKGDSALKASALAMLGQEVAVLFETNGLALTETLDTSAFMTRTPALRKLGDRIAVTPGTGYLVEPLSVRSTQIFRYTDDPEPIMRDREDIEVAVRIYAPAGHHILAVNAFHVLAATDDAGRKMAFPEPARQKNEFSTIEPADLSRPPDQADGLIRLPAPARLPRAIQTLRFEVEVVSGTGWEKYPLQGSRIEAGATFKIDTLISGGRLAISSIRDQGGSYARIEMALSGGDDLHEIFFAVRQEHQWRPSYVDEEPPSEDRRTRKIVLNCLRDKDDKSLPDLLLRRPAGLRREKATLVLKDIDLF